MLGASCSYFGFLVIGGWRLAVSYWLLAVGGWRLAVSCWLLAVGWLKANGQKPKAKS